MYLTQYEERSLKQHNVEWLYYRIISDCTGHTPYEVYETMAMRFLKVIDEDGDLAFILPTKLNTLHHNLYLEQIRAFASKYGIMLPEPTTDPGQQYPTKKARL